MSASAPPDAAASAGSSIAPPPSVTGAGGGESTGGELMRTPGSPEDDASVHETSAAQTATSQSVGERSKVFGWFIVAPPLRAQRESRVCSAGRIGEM
jgi:hypothetical protein